MSSKIKKEIYRYPLLAQHCVFVCNEASPLRRPVDSGREQGGIYMFVSRPSMTKIVRCTTRLLFIENEMIDNLVFFLSPSPNLQNSDKTG